MDAAAAFTDATNTKALSEQSMDSKAGGEEGTFFPWLDGFPMKRSW